ncbi:MAG: cobalt ECF transporter T component CbiQ [Clostridiales bacterium]|jgi:cobalt/nickel transport system permease protein|nr:cobalt ECF transporter T component CbiQ [Clostridiales bacterium]
MFYIDQFVYTNKMRNSHPGERLAFALATMFISVTVNQPVVHLTVVAIMVGFLAFRAKIPGYVILKLFSVPVTSLLVGVMTIAVQINRFETGMLFSMNVGSYYLGVTKASAAVAVVTLLKSLSAVSCLYFFVLTTPMIEVIYTLKLLRAPAVFLDLMMLVYRFIFIFVETAFQIYTSQSSRWGYLGFRRSIHSFGLLFANLWAKSFIKSQAIFTSLLSRGYEGELNVVTPAYNWSSSNLLLFGFIDLGLILMALYSGVVM